MDIQYIDKQLQTIEEALGWISHVPVSERLGYRKKLINLRRGMKKVRFAISEPCSTAAFGESQMGKSYLVSALLSTPNHPFAVTNGNVKYDFISQINPSRPNSTIEATGVITRFTTKRDLQLPEGFLKVQLLSLADIILILCEAYYNQVDYEQKNVLSKDEINDILHNTNTGQKVSQSLLFEDDLSDVKEYLTDSSLLRRKCDRVLESDFFDFLLDNLGRLDEAQLIDLIKLLWNKEENITRLWTDMLDAYRKVDFHNVVYTQFESVLKNKGTLMDVARLDEMYGEPEDAGQEYDPYTKVKVLQDDEPIQIEKSFFSALIAELTFNISPDLAVDNGFLNDLDILDFPGARRPEQIKEVKLGEGKNLSTVLRRGKVTYLFNKYSSAKRINTLLFCHNNSMSGESSMGDILDKWVRDNVGEDESKREEYLKISGIPPLFIIGTWFNKDLEYHDEDSLSGDSLNARWNRRFSTVLEKEVLKSLNDEKHWLNSWSKSVPAFQNIYMLRDFKYSKEIYDGYDPINGHPESGEPVRPENFPDYFNKLKKSFVENDFVKKHFSDPNLSWEAAASCAKDGTSLIVEGLNRIAPNVSKARNEKFESDVKQIIKSLKALLEQYYHPEDTGEQLKIAKRQSGAACLQIDKLKGRDSYFFGKLMQALSVSESEVYELAHDILLGAEQQLPVSDQDANIFASANLSTNVSKEENVERLCDYLGADSYEDCKEILEENGVDIEAVLSLNQIKPSRAGLLVDAVEQMWHDRILVKNGANTFESLMPSINAVVSNLWTVYRLSDAHTTIINKVKGYLENLDKESSVGVISDYISSQLNKFTDTFGYEFISAQQRQVLLDKNKQLRLNIDVNMLERKEEAVGVDLLSVLYEQRDRLSSSSFGQEDRDSLARLPQYGRLWQWEQRMKAGFVLACQLPDYDVNANAKLGTILEKVK